jgi:hypothetical protein
MSKHYVAIPCMDPRGTAGVEKFALPERRVTVYSGDLGNTFSLLGESNVPWKECQIAEERLRFVARPLYGEKMSLLRREFGNARHQPKPAMVWND